MTRRECSAALFGNRFVAEVVTAIQRLAPNEDSAVTTRTIAAATGLSDSFVRPVMLRLVDAGLLTPTDRAGPRTMLLYRVRREPLWSAVANACAIIAVDTSDDAPSAPG